MKKEKQMGHLKNKYEGERRKQPHQTSKTELYAASQGHSEPRGTNRTKETKMKN